MFPSHDRDGDDKVQDYIADINALADLDARVFDSSLSATELDTVVDASGNMTVSQVGGLDFADYSDLANPVVVYSGIETDKFENSTSTTTGVIASKLADNESITADKIADLNADEVLGAHGGTVVGGGALQNRNFYHSNTNDQVPESDAQAERYTNITGVGQQSQELNMTSGVSSTSYKIVNLTAMPGVSFDPQDLVSKEYVDSACAGS